MTTADLRPAEYNIHEVAGADLSIVITCYEDDGTTPLDVSGYTFAADVLRSGAVVDSFATAVTGDDDNILTLTLTDTETAAIGTGRGLEWALKVTAGGLVDWWYGGEFRLYNAGTPRENSSSNSVTAVVGGSITAALTAGVPANDAVLAGFINDPASDTSVALAAQYLPKSGQTLWVNYFGSVLGSPSQTTIFRRNFWLLDGASTPEGLSCDVVIPPGWATFHIDMVWVNAGAGSGDIAIRLDRTSDGDGDTLSANPAAGTPTAYTAQAQNVIEVSRLRTGLTVTSLEVESFNVVRLPTDALDTLGNDIGVRGLLLTRAS